MNNVFLIDKWKKSILHLNRKYNFCLSKGKLFDEDENINSNYIISFFVDEKHFYYILCNIM